MTETTKIEFRYRKISQLADFGELVEMLFPGNRNQHYAAACNFFELKWADSLLPNMAHLETKYNISRRILQQTRAKLSCLGLIEHVSYLNSRYGGQDDWKLSSRFEAALKQFARRIDAFKDIKSSTKEKDLMLITFADAQRKTKRLGNSSRHIINQTALALAKS